MLIKGVPEKNWHSFLLMKYFQVTKTKEKRKGGDT